MFPLRPTAVSTELISSLPTVLRTSTRSITYLNVGSRIRGMKRDPSSYMKNQTGLDYNAAKDGSSASQSSSSQSCQDKVRDVFRFKSYNIDLPNDIILQCLTHKSFAHGSLPYNEKLQLLGSHFLKLRASVHSLNYFGNNQQQEATQFSVNGCNFNNLGSQVSKKMVSKKALGDVVRKNDLQDMIFWKMRDPVQSGAYNGEDRVFSSVVNSLVGALLITNGPEKTAKFVDGYFFQS